MRFPGRNISQIFLEIFSDFLRNFFRISVGFGTLMRNWEIFPNHSFSTVFRNCSPIFFFNSQRFPHHFPDFLWFLNNTRTFRKANNENIWDVSKDFLIFFDFLKIVVSSVLLDSKKIKAIRGKYEVFYIIFQISSFSDFLIIYGSKINNHLKYTKKKLLPSELVLEVCFVSRNLCIINFV